MDKNGPGGGSGSYYRSSLAARWFSPFEAEQ